MNNGVRFSFVQARPVVLANGESNECICYDVGGMADFIRKQ